MGSWRARRRWGPIAAGVAWLPAAFAQAGTGTGTGTGTGATGTAAAASPQPAEIRIGLERSRLPGAERLGLLGSSYLLEVGPGLWFGPGAYGAISGRRGGLFVVGAELAWRQRLAGPLHLDVGAFAGGGGGGSAPVGGGLMLRPHADLLWDFGAFLAGVSASQVRFANGAIDSRQLGLVWSWRTDFQPLSLTEPAHISASGGAGIGIDRVQAVAATYRPRSGARRVTGAALDGSVGLVGMHLEHRIGEFSYAGIEAAGAARGGVAGYAEYLATWGVETDFGGSALRLGARVALGMGGGGEIDVGGGLLATTELLGRLRLADGLWLGLGAGLARAPQGSFSATRLSAALEWDLAGTGRPTAIARTDWVGGTERYHAQRRNGSALGLDAVTFAANRFITKQVYLSGQVHSAYAGGAGGYTAGLLGVGAQTTVWRRLEAGGELLVGAAGGGGVSTQGGAVAQPSVYLGLVLSPALSLRVGAGRIKALRSHGLPAALDATVIGASLVYRYGVARGEGG